MVVVPLSTPELDSDIPAGRDPSTCVYVPVFVAESVSVFSVYLHMSGRVDGVDQTGFVATMMVNVRSATRFDRFSTVFRARIVNVLVPVAETLPLIAPEDDRSKPAGSEPDCRV